MINELRACSDRRELAYLLGVAPKELSYILYITDPTKKYRPFCISKKNGGTRNILAPNAQLKFVQNKLLDLLYECESDLNKDRSPNLSFGFRRGFSPYDNADRHRCRAQVLNLDIVDFFDQFNFGRVRGFFIKDRRFLLQPPVATTIAQIACFDNKLPQGSPCSPYIADLCASFFDQRMVRFLRPLRCRYSRYADDITISTSLGKFPALIAVADDASAQGWLISEELTNLFTRSGFSINQAKVRLSTYSSRQMVTGLVVNRRPNVTREYYLQTRAMCHRLFNGKPLAVQPICAGHTNSCDPQNPPPVADAAKHLEGRMSYIDHIKSRGDIRELREQQDDPTQFFKLLLKYFVFKYFYGNDRPMLLTEGPSDVAYIRSACRTTAVSVPQLFDGQSFRSSFFKFGSRQSEVMGLTGGCGTLKRFLYLYKHYASSMHPPGKRMPVVILVDNDKAGGEVVKMINGLYGTSISMQDPGLWSRVRDHLYVVKTPLAPGQKNSCIEDSLPASVRKVVLNGKTFSSLPKFDTSKHFGKVALAGYVQANRTSISLAGLDALLIGLNDAIADGVT